MTAVLLVEGDEGAEELHVRLKFEVCGTCDGKGKHVNPSIDADHGITRDEFNEDPDFAESYFRGDYDVPCAECHGQRVVPVADDAEGANTPAILKAIEDRINDQYEYARECAAERRYGA